MIGEDEARDAMRAAHDRMAAAAPLEIAGMSAGSADQALNTFAGTDMEGEAVLQQLSRIRGLNGDPLIAGAALLGFWFGWEIRARAES